MDAINMLTDRVKNLTAENEQLTSQIGELRKSTEVTHDAKKEPIL